MERTFKHKKTGEVAYYKDGVCRQGRFCVEIGVEPSSEFWEEVVEKDYEILSFRASTGLLRIKDYDGLFQANGDVRRDNTTEQSLLKGGWDIYSVKRLNDGEIFTIGDKIKDGNIITKIDRFFIKNDNLLFTTEDTNCGNYLINLIKYKQPLFTTQDNVDLKFGDKFYVVDTQYFKIFEAEAGITFKSEKWIKNSYADKKLAEEWIVMNKPVLSLNNLLSVWGAMENKDFYAISPLFKNFKEIAENKIKNQ
jgi:hypothetical protein